MEFINFLGGAALFNSSANLLYACKLCDKYPIVYQLGNRNAEKLWRMEKVVTDRIACVSTSIRRFCYDCLSTNTKKIIERVSTKASL